MQFLKTGVYPALNNSNFSPAQQFISTIQRFNHGGPFSYQWNAQVDFEISPSTTLSVNYLGLKGLFLPSAIGGNVAPTNLTLANGKADYAIAPGSTVARTLNPLVSPLSFFYDARAQSSYHSGTVSLAKRFSGHYSIVANYTWSHTIDSGGDPSLNGTPEDPYRRYLEKANSKQDVPQRFVAAVTAEAPRTPGCANFRFALIASAQAAGFYSVFAGTDVNHDGNANTDRVALLGRNTYRGDPLFNLDIRAARVFRFTEKLDAEFVAEAFNLTNTLNVTDINTVYGSPNFIGAVPQHFGDGAAGPAREFRQHSRHQRSAAVATGVPFAILEPGMKTLIVYAHPEPLSFNAAMKNAAVEVLTGAGSRSAGLGSVRPQVRSRRRPGRFHRAR